MVRAIFERVPWDPFVYEGDGWQVERTGWESLVYRDAETEVSVSISHVGGHGGVDTVVIHRPGGERVTSRVAEACERLFDRTIVVS